MKYIYLNLKRFDVPVAMGGVNRLAPMADWGRFVVTQTQEALRPYARQASFVHFFPEAHLLSAAAALTPSSPVQLGCQGVYRSDIDLKSNRGSFTANRPAALAAALGCQCVLIGHCEERNDKLGVLAEAGVSGERASQAVNRLLNREIHCTIQRSMSVLYCVGEREDERENWKDVLAEQLAVGLAGVDMRRITVAYEPIWAIGPGRSPAPGEYISEVARFIKETVGNVPVVYGGGLKAENAQMLASIPEIDGGLIALTRFQGDIGFYPEEYLSIVRLYLGKADDL